MALSPQAALETVKAVLDVQREHELRRLNRISAAMRPYMAPGEFVPTVQIPEDAPALMKELARKSRTNYLPLLVKTFSQVMKVDGYTSASDDGADDPWVWWQRNRMDSRQTGITRAALTYGVSYASVLPGAWGLDGRGPAVSAYSPRAMTALYADVEADEWPMLAVGVDDQADGSSIVTLIDDELVYRFGVEVKRPLGALPALSMFHGGGYMTFIDSSPHGFPVPPVVRFRDRNLLAGEESLGIVEPLLTKQEHIDEATFQGMVVQYVQAFKQRYVIGWVPKDEREQVKASAARIWYIDADPADVKVDELEAMTSSPWLDASREAKRDFAAMGQIPAQTLGIDGISNISDATLAGLEAAKNREASEIMTSLGESNEQLLRLCAFVDGNRAAAEDYTSEVRWRNFEARSFAQTVDGLGKLSQMLGVPGEDLLEDIPGWTGQRIERVRGDIRRTQARATIASLTRPATLVAPDAVEQ